MKKIQSICIVALLAAFALTSCNYTDLDPTDMVGPDKAFGNVQNVHKAVVEAGEEESGITIHYVNEHYDQGDIIFQAHTEVYPDDTPEDVAEKVHALEYQYYPQIVDQLICEL